MEIFRIAQTDSGLTSHQIREALYESLNHKNIKKVLLVPPDFTRFHSNAGLITNTYYHYLTENKVMVDILPALGTHVAMSREECLEMYGDIPYEKFLYHNWRKDVVKLGKVPSEFVSEITEGLWDKEVIVEINKVIMDESYDLIISIGQVVPHEVIGMANHAKNLFVGCGGKDMINSSHMIGAVYGMEQMMGKDHTPVRKVLDYALEHYLAKRPILFVLTVTTAPNNKICTHGLFIGEHRKALERAIALAQEKNIYWLDKPIKKCIVYLDPKEFKSTWLGNKAIYRTRMAIADGGELIVLAPGVVKFGEDLTVDKLIRKYGYLGRLKILELFKNKRDLQQNMGMTAHLIHGSSDGRFKITYAVTHLTRAEIEKVNFTYASYDDIVKVYDPQKLRYGWNTLANNEEVYFIPNPALGLWIDKNRF